MARCVTDGGHGCPERALPAGQPGVHNPKRRGGCASLHRALDRPGLRAVVGKVPTPVPGQPQALRCEAWREPSRGTPQARADLPRTRSTCGADAYAGTSFEHAGTPDADAIDYLDTDCGWTFGGYAAPLYDHPANHVDAWGAGTTDSSGTPCTSAPPSQPLYYHLSATSTSTVRLNDSDGGTYRIYFPTPRLISSCGTSVRSFPRTLPLGPSGNVFPTQSEWSASGRFSSKFFGFLDSSDGLGWPIYGPRMASARTSGGCPSAFAVLGWEDAGWTSTAVPGWSCEGDDCDAEDYDDPDEDGVYIVYRDVTVLNLTGAEIGGGEFMALLATAGGRVSSVGTTATAGEIAHSSRTTGGYDDRWAETLLQQRMMASTGQWTSVDLPDGSIIPELGDDTTSLAARSLYVMILVEARSLEPFLSSSDCHAAIQSCGDLSGVCPNPFTRVVLFASENPDFGVDDIVPQPGVAADAIVLLQPDHPSGGLGPADVDPDDTDGTCASEWYGVPHAVATPDQSTVLLYVPHLTERQILAGGDSEKYVPERVRERYACGTSAYRGQAPWPLWPLWLEGGGGGTSCFAFSLSDLRKQLFKLIDAKATGDAATYQAALADVQAVVQGAVADGYRAVYGVNTGGSVGSRATTGDVDQDGQADLVVNGGDPWSNLSVFHGPLGGGARTIDAADATLTMSDGYTRGLMTAPDLVGEGLSTVVVGNPFCRACNVDGMGAVFLVTGPVTGTVSLDDDAIIVEVGGYSVAVAEDATGDGHPDLVVGDYGSAYLFSGPITAGRTADDAAAVMVEDNASEFYDDFGNASATADLNGDGLSEVVVAEPHGSYGEVFVFQACRALA